MHLSLSKREGTFLESTTELPLLVVDSMHGNDARNEPEPVTNTSLLNIHHKKKNKTIEIPGIGGVDAHIVQAVEEEAEHHDKGVGLRLLVI